MSQLLECVEPDDEAYADYGSRFGPYNKRAAGYHVQTFSMVRRENGRIRAAGRGHVYLGALEVRGLWVDEDLRGEGVGRALLRAIEDEARRRGASRAMLYTYSWQAEGFYRAEGYETYARFDFPDGPYRIDMAKDL